ncbi:MAG: glycosyltransferase [Bacteroidales bacterium]|nr:glycosyltransferase [Bacteroidales bacterium]
MNRLDLISHTIVFFVIEDLGPGGAQRQIVNLALDLKAGGHLVSFLAYYPKPFHNTFLTEKGIHIELLLGKSPFSRVLAIRKYIRSGDFDGVIAFLGTPAFICELAAIPFRRWKLIVGERSANPNLRRKFKLKFKRYFHFFVDYIVSNSYTNMEMVRAINPLLPARKCRVIYNSFDLGVYKPVDDFKFRKSGNLNIVIPASYRKLKNLFGLIEAVSALNSSERQNLEIHWYGDRSPKAEPDFILEEAEALIEAKGLHDVFTLHNSEFEIHKVIQQADAMVCSAF